MGESRGARAVPDYGIRLGGLIARTRTQMCVTTFSRNLRLLARRRGGLRNVIRINLWIILCSFFSHPAGV